MIENTIIDISTGANDSNQGLSLGAIVVYELLQEIETRDARIAEFEEFKMIVEGCGFEVITEPPVLNHPERKILKGHGTIYVPELPEPPEVK